MHAFGHPVATCCDLLGIRLDYQPLFGERSPSSSRGGPTRHERAAETEPSWVLKIELMRIPRRHIVAPIWPNGLTKRLQNHQMLHEKLDHFQIWANNTQHVQHATTRRNRMAKRARHFAPEASGCSQQCCGMLRWNVAIDLLAGAVVKWCPYTDRTQSALTGRQKSVSLHLKDFLIVGNWNKR